MNSSKNNAAKVADFLLQINAVKLQPSNPFKWASGWNSPIYCDNRKILAYPKIREFIKNEFISLIKEFDTPTCIAGVATGGIAIGAIVAEELGLPFCYVRSESKSHGMKNNIEGDLKQEDKVFVIEDLISSGKSSIKAVRDLKEFGVEITGLGAIFTYGFEVSENNFSEEFCSFKTLSNYSVLLETALKNNYISNEELETLVKWRNSPSTWTPNA
ncbi:MAG: orotate phosphoribosyltransferase [Crocinitomicaceae bacterium]|mgnify:FL=1|jgi:orotate phosphoribosyltransferase|nr:orotate phosphoribosyltransferase [Crocinitomicaceae bacterium]|tara:strand:- start:7629 stop:8273 length:645 start_codon:yes stop_codon:yes gene_type:complete